MPPYPHAFARDERLPVAKLGASTQRGMQRVGYTTARQQRRDRRRGLHSRQQAVGGTGRCPAALIFDQRQATICQIRERTRYTVEALDSDGLQIRTECGFDCTLPAVVDDQVLRQPPSLVERLVLQPAIHLLAGLAERPFLQRLERGQSAAFRLELLAELVQVGRDLRFLISQLLDLLPDRVQCANRIVASGRQAFLVPDKGLEPPLEIHEAQAGALFDVLLFLFLEPLALRTQLLQARTFDLDRAFGRGEFFAALLPPLTPLL